VKVTGLAIGFNALEAFHVWLVLSNESHSDVEQNHGNTNLKLCSVHWLFNPLNPPKVEWVTLR
jgi:hypothetical protein